MNKLTEAEKVAMEARIQELQLEKEKRQNKPPIPAEQIASIVSKIKELNLESAYYIGNSDRGLIEALSDQMGKDNVSICDMTGRWPIIALDEDEFPEGAEDAARPDWMKSITAYFEGSPMFVDLMIEERDPNSMEDNGWVRAPYRQPVRAYALIGPARNVTRLQGFTWSEEGGVLFAIPIATAESS
jgi:hypothetical protein